MVISNVYAHENTAFSLGPNLLNAVHFPVATPLIPGETSMLLITVCGWSIAGTTRTDVASRPRVPSVTLIIVYIKCNSNVVCVLW